MFSAPTFAKKSKGCRSGFQKVSCEGVKGAAKNYYCSKKKPSEKRKAKICKKKRRS